VFEFELKKSIHFYEDETYKVTIHHKESHKSLAYYPEILQLSITRKDGNVCGWQELQDVKNDLTSEHFDAVQIFPKKINTVNASNAYHLFVFADEEWYLPFGLR